MPVSCIDLSNLDNYTVGNLIRNENHHVGYAWAGPLDGEYKFDADFLKSILVDARYSDRTDAQHNQLRYVDETTLENLASYGGLFKANGHNDF